MASSESLDQALLTNVDDAARVAQNPTSSRPSHQRVISNPASTIGTQSDQSSRRRLEYPIPSFFAFCFIYFAAVACIVFMPHNFSSVDKQTSFLILIGALISFISCSIVVGSYIRIMAARRHPSPIIFFRTLVNLIYAVTMIASNLQALSQDHFLDCDSELGSFVSALIEFSIITSEGWFVALIVDLMATLSNPFADYRVNMRRYHLAVWTLGIVSLIGLLNSPVCQGEMTSGVCWLRVTVEWVDGCLWSLYLGWLLLFYGYALVQVIYARCFLVGVRHTFEDAHLATRQRVVSCTLISLDTYLLYVAILATGGILLGAFNQPGIPGLAATWTKHTLVFMFSARGYTDLVVWLLFRSVARLENQQRHRASSVASSSAGYREKEKELTAAEVDLDLSPQLNPVLRSEIVFFVTTGIKTAVNHAYRQPRTSVSPSPSQSSRESVRSSASSSSSIRLDASSLFQLVNPRPVRTGSRTLENLTEFYLAQQYRFRDYFPREFRALRTLAGINDTDYVEQLQQISLEKLSEGASGSFMFFSANGRFIIKTVAKHEADTLHSMISNYTEYMQSNPKSLLSRYYGSHSLHIYSQEFHFIVIQNLFQTSRAINARYDIKGSWVNRSSTPSFPGQRARCRHCRLPYIIGRASPCRGRLEHEPDVVLKDNDFTTKIQLEPESAYEFIRQCDKDSDFLCEQGVMDYSLLVGVHNIPFNVNPQVTLQRRANRANSMAQMYKTSGTRDGNQSQPNFATLCSTPSKMKSEDFESFTKPPTEPEFLLSDETDDVTTYDPVPVVPPALIDFQNYKGFMKVEDLSELDHNLDTNDLSGISPGIYQARVVVGPGLYYVGIIDTLQRWSIRKRLERWLRILNLQDPDGVSSISPIPYRERFQGKIRQVVEHDFIRQVP